MDSDRPAAEAIRIKKYANRRLYNTATSTYVTLEDLAQMVKDGSDFVVHDAKSGEDITHQVLTQIIFEQESKGTNLLPISFLRQLIRFYGDSIQTLVPSYLDISVKEFAREQDRMRAQITEAFGTPFGMMEEQARKNMTMFTEAMNMFMPFRQGEEHRQGKRQSGQEERQGGQSAKSGQGDEISALKDQLSAIQTQLDKMTGGRDK